MIYTKPVVHKINLLSDLKGLALACCSKLEVN